MHDSLLTFIKFNSKSGFDENKNILNNIFLLYLLYKIECKRIPRFNSNKIIKTIMSKSARFS